MTTTVSQIKFGSASEAGNKELLLKWCDDAAANGGSFSIETKYTGDWYTTYTINWPDGCTPTTPTKGPTP